MENDSSEQYIHHFNSWICHIAIWNWVCI